MKTCLPQSLCSWNYHVHDGEGGMAELTFNWFSEQGGIRIGGSGLEVHKHGVASGRWTLEQSGRVIAEAYKPSAMFRKFDIRAEGLSLTLKAVSGFTRTYEILGGGEVLGRIEPRHPFTRRATLRCSDRVPDHVQLFAFWLVVITWRRASNNGAATVT